jgi:serine/threonine protein kinase
LLDDNGRVKVCDFGLSLAQPEHSKGFRSSRIVGTPLYTSPETIKGKTITTKADVYSYGVVLYAHHPSAPSVIIIMIIFIFIFILLVALNFGICFILTLFVICRWQILTRLEPFLECVRVYIFFLLAIYFTFSSRVLISFRVPSSAAPPQEDSDEVYEVVKKGQRPPLTMPPLPAETTPALRQLVVDCWQNSPRKR